MLTLTRPKVRALRWMVIAIGIGTSTSPSEGQLVKFAAAAHYATESSPSAVAIGDFNRDGKMDLAVSNLGSNCVSILLNQGDGTFGIATTFPTDDSPRGLAVGDFNRDGKIDLVTANKNGNNVSILLGYGDGSFSPATNFPAGADPSAVGIGDFNRDGRLDLAVANGLGNSTSILLGTGVGTFGAPTNYSVGFSPHSLTVADFNGDGRMDLAIANFGDANISILLGIGDGTFSPATNYSCGGSPISIVPGDFNGDGKLDLVSANNDFNDLSVLLGNGDGTFGTATHIIVPPNIGPNGNWNVATGDMNGDGKLDLISINRHSNFFSILLGNGDGSFELALQVALGTSPESVVVVDLNGDGKTDVVAANINSANVSILLNTTIFSARGFFATRVTHPGGSNSRGLTSGDLNRDGIPDLITLDYSNNSVSILLGNGTSFTAGSTFPVGGLPKSVALADFNRDGLLDLVVANSGTHNVSIFLGDGMGGFGAASNFAVGFSPFSVAVGDFNGDGILDLAVANLFSNTVSVLLGDGTGNFGAAAPYSVGTSPAAVAIGDFDGDGKLDIVSANVDSNSLSFLRGIGDGTFLAASNTTTDAQPFFITAVDLNKDGNLDLVVTTSFRTYSTLGNGDGTFGTPYIFASGNESHAIGDFDSDGNLDVVTIQQVIGVQLNAAVHYGVGDGTFMPGGHYVAGSSARGSLVADFDRDGKLDLAVVNQFDNTISLLLNIGPPTLSITNVTVNEGSTGFKNTHIAVNLSHAFGQVVSVDVTTDSGSALADVDFQSISGSLIFEPGQTSKIISVPILGETTVEGDETFVVNLSNATVGLDNTQSTVTIINDDDGGLNTTVNVDCATSSLQTAINNALPGTAIIVAGTCTENILVRNEKQRIAIHGGGSASINALSNTSSAVTIRGKGITLSGFTITGGFDGVAVQRGSNAVINTNTIQNSLGSGIAISQLAFAVITNNLITNHSNGAGIFVSETSAARIGFNSDTDTIANPNQIHTNQVGIAVANASSARIVGNYIHNNSQQGILVLRDSHADISANDIDENGNQGIELSENSVVLLGESSGSSIFELPNDTAQPNTNYGLKCTTGGVVSGRLGTLLGTLGSPKSIASTCIDNLGS